MKLELLVIANQHVAVNSFLTPYTPPVTLWEASCSKLRFGAARYYGTRNLRTVYSKGPTGVKS